MQTVGKIYSPLLVHHKTYLFTTAVWVTHVKVALVCLAPPRTKILEVPLFVAANMGQA